jgi:hypothetical protein
VLDAKSTRDLTAQDVLADGEPHGAWATGPYWLTSRDPLESLGLKELNLGKEVTDAARSTLVRARRRRRYTIGGRVPSLVRRHANLRARACAWVRTRVEVSDSGLGPALAVNRRRGGDHGGAQADAMGGGGQGNRSSGTNA